MATALTSTERTLLWAAIGGSLLLIYNILGIFNIALCLVVIGSVGTLAAGRWAVLRQRGKPLIMQD